MFQHTIGWCYYLSERSRVPNIPVDALNRTSRIEATSRQCKKAKIISEKNLLLYWLFKLVLVCTVVRTVVCIQTVEAPFFIASIGILFLLRDSGKPLSGDDK